MKNLVNSYKVFFDPSLKLRDKFPRLYLPVIRLISVWKTFARYRKIIFNGKEAHWYIQQMKGEDFLNRSWNPINSIETRFLFRWASESS
jgi:hypothetical protein